METALINNLRTQPAFSGFAVAPVDTARTQTRDGYDEHRVRIDLQTRKSLRSKLQRADRARSD